MNGYHFNGETGKGGVCRAREKCPLGSETVHFKTKNEMNGYIENYEKSKNAIFTTNKRLSAKEVFENEIKNMLNSKTMQITKEGLEKIKFNNVGGNYIHINSTFSHSVLIHDSNGKAIMLQSGEDYNNDNKNEVLNEVIRNFENKNPAQCTTYINQEFNDHALAKDKQALIFNNSMRVKSVIEDFNSKRTIKRLEEKYGDRVIIATDGSVTTGKYGRQTYGYLTTNGEFLVNAEDKQSKNNSDSFRAELLAINLAVNNNLDKNIAVIMDSDEVFNVLNNDSYGEGKRVLTTEEKEIIDFIRNKIKSNELITEVVKSHSNNSFNNAVDLILRGTFQNPIRKINTHEFQDELQPFVRKKATWLNKNNFSVPYDSF